MICWREQFFIQRKRMNVKIQEIVIVEGKKDTEKIKQAVQADTIETGGLAIDQAFIERLRYAEQKRGIIIFTDPDFAGEKIRRMIQAQIPGCKHAFLTQEQAKSNRMKKSLGVEHATIQDIRDALKNLYEQKETKSPLIHKIHKIDLIHHNLLGKPQSKERRKRLGEILKIGYANGKQLLNRLHMFQIEREAFERAVQRINKEVEKND